MKYKDVENYISHRILRLTVRAMNRHLFSALKYLMKYNQGKPSAIFYFFFYYTNPKHLLFIYYFLYVHWKNRFLKIKKKELWVYFSIECLMDETSSVNVREEVTGPLTQVSLKLFFHFLLLVFNKLVTYFTITDWR